MGRALNAFRPAYLEVGCRALLSETEKEKRLPAPTGTRECDSLPKPERRRNGWLGNPDRSGPALAATRQLRTPGWNSIFEVNFHPFELMATPGPQRPIRDQLRAQLVSIRRYHSASTGSG